MVHIKADWHPVDSFVTERGANMFLDEHPSSLGDEYRIVRYVPDGA